MARDPFQLGDRVYTSPGELPLGAQRALHVRQMRAIRQAREHARRAQTEDEQRWPGLVDTPPQPPHPQQ